MILAVKKQGQDVAQENTEAYSSETYTECPIKRIASIFRWKICNPNTEVYSPNSEIGKAEREVCIPIHTNHVISRLIVRVIVNLTEPYQI